jgi:hypothetical protein
MLMNSEQLQMNKRSSSLFTIICKLSSHIITVYKLQTSTELCVAFDIPTNCCSMEDPPSKRQKATIDDTPGHPPSPAAQNDDAVVTAINDLTKLAERDPRLHSKLEGMLKGVLSKLESEASAII